MAAEESQHQRTAGQQLRGVDDVAVLVRQPERRRRVPNAEPGLLRDLRSKVTRRTVHDLESLGRRLLFESLANRVQSILQPCHERGL